MRMYKTFSSLDWKILVAICFITFGLIALFLFLSNRPPAPSTPKPAWFTYNDPDYSISYPAGVTVNPGVLTGGGKVLVFNLPNPQVSFRLEVLPGLDNNIASLSAALASYGYPESKILVSGKEAKKFSGSSTLEPSVQKTAILLENKSQVFRFKLSYAGNQRDSQLDNLFNQILTTFRLN